MGEAIRGVCLLPGKDDCLISSSLALFPLPPLGFTEDFEGRGAGKEGKGEKERG